MDDNKLQNKLISLGMRPDDAGILIANARAQGVGIRKALAMRFIGAYQCMAAYVFVCFLFIYQMDKEDVILFTLIYGFIFSLIYFLTPFLKGFFWSLLALFKLRGE